MLKLVIASVFKDEGVEYCLLIQASVRSVDPLNVHTV